MKGLQQINRVHAWIVVDDDGTEGIPMIEMPGLGPVPMMCGDQQGAVAAFDQAAQMVAGSIKKDVHHYVFDSRVLDKTWHP